MKTAITKKDPRIAQFIQLVYPPLLMDDSFAARRILHLGLPYDQQKELYEKLIPVAVPNGSGIKTEWKRACELTHIQATVAIGEGGANTVERQIQTLNERKERETKTQYRYAIERGVLRIFPTKSPITFTRADLEKILADEQMRVT